MESYESFIKEKSALLPAQGFSAKEINEHLFGFQKDIVRWALKRGRAAIFAGTGLGKTRMQVEWAAKVSEKTGGNVLLLAPLAVATQTVREAAAIGYSITYCHSQEDVESGLNITNYEKLQHFDVNEFDGVVLDESSILKSFTGKVRTALIELFENTPFRLACTATPAPNDFMEIGNHAEFLGVMKRQEMLSMFFVHDGGNTSKWRLKGHAEDEFWKWVASWGVELWSNHDDIILSPFAGIGSEGYESIKMGRRFVGVELKESYYNLAVRNLQEATLEYYKQNSSDDLSFLD